MSYSFRIRVNRCSSTTIQTETNEMAIPTDTENISIYLRAPHENSLKEAEEYALIGSGYSTEESANTDGIRYHDAVMVAFAASRVGVDFGLRAAKGAFTHHGLKWAEKQFGVRALNNVHGLMVYESEPSPRFVEMQANAVMGANSDNFSKNLYTAVESKPVLSERELVSFTLFNASFFQPTADSRFILLVMAIEALIEPQMRNDDAVVLVDSLIQQAKLSNLEANEKNSVIGSLSWLRKESINQAGKRLATERLGLEAKFENSSPANFFAKCYQIRSNLVHGNMPFPSFEVVGSVVATLEVFVSNLLTQPYISQPLKVE
jgi:hypothetical protein